MPYVQKYHKCYYDTHECKGKLWTCATCDEIFCQYHWHETALGKNVECVGCEYFRLDEEEAA